ncbi:MAG: type II secretion system secretin GspD [Chromatiales bacterium]
MNSVATAITNTADADQKDERITLNLKNTDVRTLIESMSQLTGKNFIVDPRVKGNVTIVSAEPVDKQQAYEIFVSVLKVHGFAVVPSGKAYKVIPSVHAKQDNVPTLPAEQHRLGDALVSQVIHIRFADVTQLVPMLKPLLPAHAHLAADINSNSLLVTDSADNINRILEIVAQIDVADDSDTEIIAIRNTQASDLAATLEGLQLRTFSKNQAAKDNNKIIADDRTNSLVISGESQWRRKIRRLAHQLDKPSNQSDYTEVIYLRHATAKNLLDVLTGVSQHQLGAKGGATASPVARSGNQKFDIQADEETNSLVITAPPFLAKTLKSVISQLDIRRAQVHIQAIIAEIKYNRTVELGVEWRTNIPNNGRVAVSKLPIAGSTTSSIDSFPGAAGSGFSLGYITNGTLTSLLKAFASDGDANILSTPSLVTLDNEEASIHVGQNVPFVTGQYTGNDSNAGENPFQTIERHDIGIKLKVKPHINEGDTIKLTIEQEVSNVDAESTVDGLVTNKRVIETTVLVDDEEVIVLGGLIEDELTESTSKVPLLGDIPLFGQLFRSQKTAKDKRNLMVFLRPQIIRDKLASNTITNKHYMEMQDLQQGLRANGVLLMPDEQPPLLPDLDSKESDIKRGNPFLDNDF